MSDCVSFTTSCSRSGMPAAAATAAARGTEKQGEEHAPSCQKETLTAARTLQPCDVNSPIPNPTPHAPSPVMAEVGTMEMKERGSLFFQYSATFRPCSFSSSATCTHKGAQHEAQWRQTK